MHAIILAFLCGIAVGGILAAWLQDAANEEERKRGSEMANEIAPEGKIFQCMACGKKSRDLYGEQALDNGWDESCMLNAALKEDYMVQLSEEERKKL